MAELSQSERELARRIDLTTGQRILLDVCNKVSVEESKLKYGADELEFRKQLEQDCKDSLAKYPDAIIDIKE